MAQSHISPLFHLFNPLLKTFRCLVSTSTPATRRTVFPIRQHSSPSTTRTSTRKFTTSRSHLAGKNAKNKPKDNRITLIRYHLMHPKTPRPLRFSRMRALRHWTIHRAWMIFRRRKKAAEELEMQRMYQSMQAACEELRLLDGPDTKDGSRLFRIAMEKKGIFRPGGVPIEYARAQTETPGVEAWNHGWIK